MASSLLETIGYAKENELEDRRRHQPNFSTPETLTSHTREALNEELLDAGIIEKDELTTDGGRLTLSALNTIWRLMSDEEKVFTVRRDFFREILEEDNSCHLDFSDNDVGRSDQFTREGLAKVVEKYCEID